MQTQILLFFFLSPKKIPRVLLLFWLELFLPVFLILNNLLWHNIGLYKYTIINYLINHIYCTIAKRNCFVITCVLVHICCKLQNYGIFRIFGKGSIIIKLGSLKNAGKGGVRNTKNIKEGMQATKLVKTGFQWIKVLFQLVSQSHHNIWIYLCPKSLLYLQYPWDI